MIDVAFSHTELSPSIVISVPRNIRVESTSRNVYDFTMKDSEYVFNAAPSEMENHADMHIFGRNFRVYFTTSKRCTVSPFLPEYLEQLNVNIVTVATAVDLENGLTVVLIFGQSL